MEAKILAGVLHTDTHTRLQAGEQLLEYLRNEENQLAEFEDLEELIKGLANWMSSSNFRVRDEEMNIKNIYIPLSLTHYGQEYMYMYMHVLYMFLPFN